MAEIALDYPLDVVVYVPRGAFVAVSVPLLIVLCLLAAGCLGVSAWVVLVARDSPGRRGALQVQRIQEAVDRLDHAWAVKATELERLHEVILETLESVEKKRRQAASSRTKAEAAERRRDGEADQVDPDLMTDDALIQVARSRGLWD